MKKLTISLLTFLMLLSGAITFVNADTTTSTPIQPCIYGFINGFIQGFNR